MQIVDYPTYYSTIFNKTFNTKELDDLDLEDLVILQDEANVDLQDAVWKYKTLPKKDKTEGTSWVIADYRNLKIFHTALKRVVYYKTKSLNACLEKCKTAWKKRALILGEQLGMNKRQVKELAEVA